MNFFMVRVSALICSGPRLFLQLTPKSFVAQKRQQNIKIRGLRCESEDFKVSNHYQKKFYSGSGGVIRLNFFTKMLPYREKGTCLPQSAVITFINLVIGVAYLHIEEYYISEWGYQDAWDDGCDR